jgi:2-polyprenyl-3-methyl-5-hydroxy-6-metoxy-1,4-benzoquinol methylase
MTLALARPIDDEVLPRLTGDGPYACADLADWRGRRFLLPPTDLRLSAIHEGGDAPEPAWDNLVGAARWWSEHNDWMNFLHPDSPSHRDKLLERQLYLDHWGSHIPSGARVLDLGGGIGRFTQWLLQQDCTVELADADLRSLWCAVSHAAGGPGSLNVHWTTGERLPELAPVDVALAVEVLCYVADPGAVLRRIRDTLRPGGTLLVSVEAQYGWAMSPGAASGSLSALFTDGVVHVPRDRWVRTYDEAAFGALLDGWEILDLVPSHYVLSGPFEMAAGDAGIDEVRAWERQLAANPVTRPLHRAWTAIVRHPE